MTTETLTVLCGNCKAPINAPSDPKDSDLCSCTKCGKTDRYDYVMSQAKKYTVAITKNGLLDMFRDQFKNSTHISYKAGPRANLDFDYITSHK